MRAHRVWVALLLCRVVWDFANPLVPGAVLFRDGSVQCVDAACARPGPAIVSAKPIPTAQRLEPVESDVIPRLQPVPRDPGPRRVPIGRTRATAADAASTDDH